MKTREAKFIGAIMKAIVCTPNKNFEASDYEERVIIPAEKFREMQKQPESVQLNQQSIDDMLQTLQSILEAKQVDQQEIHTRLADVRKVIDMA